ncbi:MAG: hypothetical protein U5L09_21275 [Bacteroidales bacterium]|nr:hypothetical protein [Bacteroidales bacterium]
MVKDRYPHLKVIALTAYALPEDRINALAAGMRWLYFKTGR